MDAGIARLRYFDATKMPSFRLCLLTVCLMSYVCLGQPINKKLCGRDLPKAVFVVCGFAKRGSPPKVHTLHRSAGANDNVGLVFARYRRPEPTMAWEWTEYYNRRKRSTLRITAQRCCQYGCSIRDLSRIC